VKGGQDVLEGSYIVAFKTERGGPALDFATYEDEYRAHFLPLQERHWADSRVKNIHVITGLDLNPDTGDLWQDSALIPPAVRGGGGENRATREPTIASLARVDFESEKAAGEVLAEWDAAGRLWFAEPNYRNTTFDVPPPRTGASPAREGTGLFAQLATTYATLANQNWALKSAYVPEALNVIASRDLAKTQSDADITSNPPIIAVMDSGVDYENVSIKATIWSNSSVGAAGCEGDTNGCNTTTVMKGVLGDGNTYPAGTSGPGDSCPESFKNCAHGTEVASVISAKPDTSSSGGGVCPVCQIMILKVVSADGGIYDSAIMAGMKYLTMFRRASGTNAVRVVNASIGKFARSKAVGLLVRLLRAGNNGAVVIGAAGNEDSMEMTYPAAFEDAIAVTAVGEDLGKAPYSNFGRWADIAAPGSSITVWAPGSSGSTTNSGTSFAAPVVSGVAGLILTMHPNISFAKLRSALLDSADAGLYDRSVAGEMNYNYYYPLPEGESVRQPLLGKGLLNAQAAVSLDSSNNIASAALNRVNSLCGVVPAGSRPVGGMPWAIALILAPLMILPSLGIFLHARARKRPRLEV
jgi:subtilisin family serine protease